ncbi:ABC transporter ATP-binding protein [Sphingorhabdus sp. Alg239-R122]|uniref:ABC transporter ATP-binding protein n=1 Tax=Sphingorhabdus sp. Alg239-R122 TaxID=2305989 RepID=UPI0013DA3741|nr:ABC transporter ATP-binding protein [Sphingorhabdus sp. Alg239-R122]
MTLAAQDISVRLGNTQILEGVHAAFARGQVSAIVGPNGAGKSTLLDCLAGLRVPDMGEVSLDDAPLTDIPPGQRAQRLGYLPQVQDVHWDIDARALVAIGRFPHRGAFAGESEMDRSAIDDAMAAMDVTGFAARSVNSLSGGERARVLVARVLATQPDWLLVDEPLANLDIAHQLDMLAALQKAAHDGGMGVVMVLHDLSHAMNFADHVLMLDSGMVAANGGPADALSVQNIENVYHVHARWLESGDGQKLLYSAPHDQA